VCRRDSGKHVLGAHRVSKPHLGHSKNEPNRIALSLDRRRKHEKEAKNMPHTIPGPPDCRTAGSISTLYCSAPIGKAAACASREPHAEEVASREQESQSVYCRCEMTARLIRAFVLAVSLLTLAGCQKSPPGPAGPSLAGDYVGWMFMDGSFSEMNGKEWPEDRMILKADGTFSAERHGRVMMEFDSVASGRFKVQNGRLILDGTVKQKMDDGYGKSEKTGAYRDELAIESGMFMKHVTPDEPYYYRKVGTGPPPVPERLRLKPSDPAAVALIKRVEQTYAALKSYADSGGVKSNGGGFLARDVKFTTRFERPNRFLFRAAQYDKDGEFAHASAWSEGGKAGSEDSEFGRGERRLGEALRIYAVTYGDSASLVPSLLMPRELSGSDLSRQPELTLLKEEVIRGHPCHVLQLRSRGGTIEKVWVDKSTLMIRQTYDGIRKGWTTIDPQPNAALTDKDFKRP
jgi:hypothetical protein